MGSGKALEGEEMILVIGGAFQGKKDYAKEAFSLADEDFTDGACCSEEELYQAKAVVHFHEYVRRCLQEGRELTGLADSLVKQNPDIIILANELGSGVVPVDAFDRSWRETTGRLCCELAKRANEVHRVVCGIGTVIKG